MEQHVCLCISSNIFIPKIVQHMTQYNCQLILIAPHWPRKRWFPNLLKLRADFSRKLPVRYLLHQRISNIIHPNPVVFNLTAWLLSTNTLKGKVCLGKLENYSKPLGEKVHKTKISLANFENSIAGVVEGKFIPIIPLWQNCLRKAFIIEHACHRSMLSSVISPIATFPVGQHLYIPSLIKGVFNSRPPIVVLLQDWDLL